MDKIGSSQSLIEVSGQHSSLFQDSHSIAGTVQKTYFMDGKMSTLPACAHHIRALFAKGKGRHGHQRQEILLSAELNNAVSGMAGMVQIAHVSDSVCLNTSHNPKDGQYQSFGLWLVLGESSDLIASQVMLAITSTSEA